VAVLVALDPRCELLFLIHRFRLPRDLCLLRRFVVSCSLASARYSS
jgi:hypothetical protein